MVVRKVLNRKVRCRLLLLSLLLSRIIIVITTTITTTTHTTTPPPPPPLGYWCLLLLLLLYILFCSLPVHIHKRTNKYKHKLIRHQTQAVTQANGDKQRHRHAPRHEHKQKHKQCFLERWPAARSLPPTVWRREPYPPIQSHLAVPLGACQVNSPRAHVFLLAGETVWGWLRWRMAAREFLLECARMSFYGLVFGVGILRTMALWCGIRMFFVFVYVDR